MANIGIDLGTTHSLVAAVLGGSARCLLDDDERALIPSVVRYDDEGDLSAVGYDALQKIGEQGGISFSSIKRFMGRSPDEVKKDAQLFHYPLADDSRVTRFQVGSKQITPIEMSAVILKTLSNQAEECLFAKPTGAVITVPAYFDDAQRQATKDAARLAGLDVLRLLNEPTAAAIAYGLQEGNDGKRVAVYDLGGGTFDVSILELNDSVFQVKSTAGDTHLGGDDFDQRLLQLFSEMTGINLTGADFRKGIRVAEGAKRRLTTEQSTEMKIEVGKQVIHWSLDREQFNTVIRPIVERTGVAIKQALKDAKLTPADIDEVVLVGGSTRVPLVRDYVEELFGAKPHTQLNPDQVVALGAALQADALSNESELDEEFLLLDVLPLSLGLEVMGGITERIIDRCTMIPASASQRFTTHADGQTGMIIHVLQGEREMVADNRSLAKFTLKGLPDLPAGVPRINVVFNIDADGIMTVEAKEEFTGITASIEVMPSHGLTDDEIEDMLDAAIENAEQDVDQRLLIEATIEAGQVLKALADALTVDKQMVTADELEKITQTSNALRDSIDKKERKKISDLTHRLDEVSAPFAQRRIERDLAIALEGRQTDEVASRLGMDK
jgi:molecular chaperone HscA